MRFGLSRTVSRWLALGLLTGAAAGLGTVVFAIAADRVIEAPVGGPAAARAAAFAGAAAVALGAMTGLGVGQMVQLRRGAAPVAVAAIVSSIVAGPVLPLLAGPIILGAGAVVLSSRTWTLATGLLAIVLSVALLVGGAWGSLLHAGDRSIWPAVVAGLAVGALTGYLALRAWARHERARQDDGLQGQSGDADK